MTGKREVDQLKEQLAFANREILRLKSKNRIARGDKDIKISEMAATIRSLSARSDMHAQLIQTKQEMEAERLANAHLRADLDTVKEMLEEEQRKCQMCRSEVSALQGMVDSVAVFQTVLNVPGVQPATLIELMSGQIVMLSSEVSKLKKNLNEAVEQSKSLQRTMQLKSNRQDDPSPFADTLRSSRSIPPSRGRARSLSPMKQSVATSPYKSTSGNASPQRLRASTSSLPLLFTEERQSPVLALDNPNFRLENYESTESHSKARLHDNLFSIVVDKEATPKMVLESLDAAILAQKVQTHENTIIELQEQIDKLTDEALQTERVRLFERDDMEAADRIELQSCAQRLELVQTQLSEAKQEAADLCEKNLGLEKTIVDMQSRILYDDPKDSTSPHYDAAESNSELESMLFDTRTRDHTSEMDIRNQDNGSSSVKLELDNTKSLLRERTAQLKIVMETLDTLQMAGVNAHDLRERGLEGLADIAASSLPTVEGSWGLQALVKRVVDLTTELSSQSALAALEERRAADLDSENRKRVKELSSLRSIAKSEEEKCAKLQIQIAALREQVTVNEKRNLDLVSSQRIENEELITAVRDAEAKVRNYEIQINDLKKQIQMTDQQDFQQWLEVITLENQKLVETPIDQLLLPSKDPLTQSSEDIFNGKTVSSSPVRDLVVGLISQWKEFVGNYTVRNPIGVTGSAARNTTTSVSKAEQRFMQRVVDLVMQANDRALTASKKAKDFEAMVKRSEMATTISSERLKFCAQQLNRYRRRCQAYEKVLHNNSNEAVIKQGKLESILRKSVASERRSYAEVYNQLRCERRDRIILEMKRAAQVLQNRKMQVRVAELEARGSAQLRGRDEAISGLEAKLKLAEDAMYSWFKVELPRLVLGMPVTEDSLAGFYSEQLHDDHLPIGSQLAASMGLDKTFALSQALCSAKATQTAQQMRITGLMEKLSILKERNLELEGVVMRWKTNILNSAGSRDTFDADCLPSIRTEDLDNLIQRIYSYSAAEAKTNEKIQVLSNRAMELEEENIETRGRLEQAEHRSEEMKQLVEVVISEEQALKAKATQQLTKIRIDLENEHAEELHRIRKAYEDERNALVTELENVALAVEEAKMTTKVDVHGPTSLIMSAKQSMFDDIKPIYSDQSSGHDSSISREQQKSKRIKPKKGSSERKRRSTSSSDSDSDGSSGDDDYRQSQLVVPGNSVRKENRPRREKGSNNSKADSFHDTQSMASSITSGQLFAVTGTASANKSIAGHGDPLSPVREDDRESAISSSSSPPSDKGSNASSEKSLKDVEVGSLQRILEIERRKHAEARYEVLYTKE